MSKKKPAAAPNRYQQWVQGGRKYHKGLSLFNEVPGMAVLKRTLERGPSTYNKEKLDAALKRHFDTPPEGATPPPPKGKAGRLNGHTHTRKQRVSDPPPQEEEPAPEPADTDTTEEEGGDGDDEDDDPYEEDIVEITPRSWKRRPRKELPLPLRRLRIENTLRYRERSKAHAALRAHPRDRDQRLALVRTIVQLTDAINAHWAIEETWEKSGALPHLPEDEAARIASADVFQLQRELVNQVRPQLARINHKLKNDSAGKKPLEEDERTALEMRRGALERTKALINERLRQYRQP